MAVYTNRFWFLALFLFTNFSIGQAQQPTLSLFYGDPSASPDEAFDGNVFRVGTQYGDAAIYAKFGAFGTKSFQIDSPGENKTVTVTNDGYFFIRPTSSMVVDATKIKNFSGLVTGSISITLKQLTISTLTSGIPAQVAPGTEILVPYVTGAGTYPVDLVVNGFTAYLIDASGNAISLLNPTDQNSGREKRAASFGGTRFLRATIPTSISNGDYRLMVATKGLLQTVTGTSTTTISVRSSNPTLATTNLSGVYCAGATYSLPFSVLGGTFPTGTTFTAQIINATNSVVQTSLGTTSTTAVPTSLPASLTGGTYYYRIASSTGVSSQLGIFTVRALPTMTISGNSVTTPGSPATVLLSLTGTPPYIFSYLDFTASGSTVVRTATTSSSNVAITPTVYSAMSYNNNYISNFSDAGGCGNSANVSGSAQISLNQLALTTGPLTGSYCPGASLAVPFSTNSPLPASVQYQVQLSDAGGSFATPQVLGTGFGSPISVQLPTTLQTGSAYRMRVVILKPTTPGVVDYSTLVSVNSTSLLVSRPPAPSVTDVSFCAGASLSPLTVSGTAITWYLANTNQSYTSAPTPSNTQSSVYYVSQTIGGCESDLATINVVRKPLPDAPMIVGPSACQGSTAQFTTALPGILWYTSANGGSGSTQGPAVNTQLVGEQTAYATQTSNGCESPRGTVKATINANPSAPGIAQTGSLCQYSSPGPLTANGSGLTWYFQGSRLAAAPVVNTQSATSYSYAVSQTINGCEGARASTTITILQAPAAPTAADVRYCVGETPRSLTATGTNIRWYVDATSGQGAQTPPAFSTAAPNQFTAYATQTDPAGCESLRQPIRAITIAPPSAPSVVANQTVCQFARATALTASPNVGLIWQGTGITGISETAPTPATDKPATFTYQVYQRAGGCTSPPAQLVYTVRAQPATPTVQATMNVCVGTSASPLQAVAAGQLVWYYDPSLSSAIPTAPVPRTDSVGVRTYYVTQKDGFGCESQASSIQVRVATRAIARLSGDDFIYPGDSSAIRIRLSGDGPWTFTNWAGRGITTSDSLYITWVRPTSTQTFAISGLRSACGAGDNGNIYTLQVRAPLAAQPLLEPITVVAYPNPTVGDLTVDWSSPTRQAVTLQIVDAAGRTIQQANRTATTYRQTDQFQLSAQPAGQYYLRIISDKNPPVVRPIIKQ
ncbi:hypothetical protein GCM10027578_30580 [Spirosoma luteolum]